MCISQNESNARFGGSPLPPPRAALRRTLTIPMHDELAIGTLQAIYRQAIQYDDEGALKPLFYTE
jgi:hypothetical protein